MKPTMTKNDKHICYKSLAIHQSLHQSLPRLRFNLMAIVANRLHEVRSGPSNPSGPSGPSGSRSSEKNQAEKDIARARCGPETGRYGVDTTRKRDFHRCSSLLFVAPWISPPFSGSCDIAPTFRWCQEMRHLKTGWLFREDVFEWSP